MAAGDRGPGKPLPAVRSGGGDWGPPGLRLRRELWPMAMELDLIGGVGRQEEVAVYGGRGRRQGGRSR